MESKTKIIVTIDITDFNLISEITDTFKDFDVEIKYHPLKLSIDPTTLGIIIGIPVGLITNLLYDILKCGYKKLKSKHGNVVLNDDNCNII